MREHNTLSRGATSPVYWSDGAAADAASARFDRPGSREELAALIDGAGAMNHGAPLPDPAGPRHARPLSRDRGRTACSGRGGAERVTARVCLGAATEESGDGA